jgi:aspartokinase-like uncharacterized kinase
MQKVFNVLTVISFGVLTIGTAAGIYVYTQREAIVEEVKAQVIKAATEGVGDALPGMLEGPSTGSGSPIPELPSPTLPF